MKIETRAQGFRTTMALSAHVEREVRKSLSGVRPRPDAVLASLSDVNGPRGGDDKRCQLRGRRPRAGEVVASAAHADMYQAIAQAADRFRRALVHRSDHRQTSRRRRIQA